MTGGDYANLVACYVSRRFGSRGLKVYREMTGQEFPKKGSQEAARTAHERHHGIGIP